MYLIQTNSVRSMILSEIGKSRFQSHVTLESRVQVRTTTLEAELEKYKRGQNIFRPFLKMDTQGHDLNAAKSARTRLQEFVGLQSELSPLFMEMQRAILS